MITAWTAAVSWEREFSGPWEMRVQTGARWGRTRELLRGRAGDLRFVGGMLTAVGVETRRNTSRVVRRTVLRAGRLSARRHVATWRQGSLVDLDLRLDAMGRTTGVLETYTNVGNRDPLIADGRARRLGLRRGESPVIAQAAGGAAAILAVRGRRRTGRIRVRPSARAPFGPWRWIRFARRGFVHDFSVGLGVREDGAAAVLSVPSPSRSSVMVTRISARGRVGRLRRLRFYRGPEPVVSRPQFDSQGRMVALITHRSRAELVRP